jgi:hypothetical protein
MKNFLTKLFYVSVGLTTALGLLLAFYYTLRLGSGVKGLIQNTTPLYFWTYMILTLGTVILFGVNAAMFAHKRRKYGAMKFRNQMSAGFGSLVGVAASACPVCGSLLLSAAGITGGLASFPFHGLELKGLSFILMALPIWLMQKDTKKLECSGACPMPRDTSYKPSDQMWLIILPALIFSFSFAGLQMYKSEPANPPAQCLIASAK